MVFHLFVFTYLCHITYNILYIHRQLTSWALGMAWSFSNVDVAQKISEMRNALKIGFVQNVKLP